MFNDDTGDSYVLLTLAGVARSDLIADGILLDGHIGPVAPIVFYGDNTDEVISGGLGDDELYGGGGNDVSSGLDGRDSIESGAGDDSIYGGSGDDTVYDSGGNGLIDGGSGNDDVYYNGQDIDLGVTLLGGLGGDYLDAYFTTGSMTIDGGDGDDQIYVNQSEYSYYYDYYDTVAPSGVETQLSVTGGAGRDQIVVQSGSASVDIAAGDGDDYVSAYLFGGSDVSATVDLGAGDDGLFLYLQNGGTTITTGEGQDYIELRGSQIFQDTGIEITDFSAGVGGDVLDYLAALGALPNFSGGNPFASGNLVFEQRGADSVLLVLGEDGETYFDGVIFRNTTVGDFVNANFVPDLPLDGSPISTETITGTNGYDELFGDLGIDVIFGLDGDDYIVGNFDADMLYGGDGDDSIFGDDAALIDGGNSNDFLRSSTDANVLTVIGGSGNDDIGVYNRDYEPDAAPGSLD